MTTDLGGIDIRVNADEKQFRRAGSGAGGEAAAKMAEGLRGKLDGIVQGALRSTGLGGLSGFASQAVGHVIGGGAGGGVARVAGGAAGGAAASATDAALMRRRGAAGAGRRALPSTGMMVRGAARHPGAAIAGAASGLGVTAGAVALGAVAVAGAAVAVGFVALNKIVGKLNETTGRQVAQLSTVNGSLAMENARRQVTALTRDIGRARVLGPSLIRLSRTTDALQSAWAPIQDTFSVMGIQLKQFIASILTPLVDLIGFIFRVLNKVNIAMVKYQRVLIDVIKTLSLGVLGDDSPAGDLFDALDKRLAENQKQLELIQQHLSRTGAANEMQEMNRILTNDLAVLTAPASRPWAFPVPPPAPAGG